MKLQKLLRQLTSILLILIFAIISISTIIGYALLDNLSSISTYEQLIEETRVIERGRGLLANGLVFYSLYSQHSNARYLSGHDLQIWESIADVLIPIPWLEENSLMVLESLVEWLDDPSLQYPNIVLDLSPIITTLQSSRGSLAIIPLFEGTPTCPPDVEEITFMGENLISCIPGGGNVALYGEKIARSISTSLLPRISIPTLVQVNILPISYVQESLSFRSSYQAFKAALLFGVQLSLLIYLIYSLLWSSSLRELLSKLPWPLYFASGFSLLLLGIIQLFLIYGINFSLSMFLPFILGEYQTLLIDVISFLSEGIKWQWFAWSIYLLFLAAGLHLMSFVSGKFIEKQSQEPQPPSQSRQRIRKQYR